VIAIRSSDLQRVGANPCLIYHDALCEGKVLYRAGR
jgi:hypothetical protein